MATKLHNLSQYDANSMPDKAVVATQRYAIVTADWNSDITYALRDGAVAAFRENGVQDENIDLLQVPGAVELTYAASSLLNADYYDAIVVIGCVIKGDTPHFDYVCQSVTQGVAALNAQGNVPVIFSVLTTLDKQQALDRAGGKLGNKGVEGAITAIKMANLF